MDAIAFARERARLRFAIALLLAGTPAAASGAGPDLSNSGFAPTPYTLSATCDLAKFAVIGLTLRNSGDAATESIGLKALDVTKELSAEMTVPPIAPGGVRDVQLELRAGAAPSAGLHVITVFLGARTLKPLGVQVAPNRCPAPGSTSARAKTGTAPTGAGAVSDFGVNRSAVLAALPSATPTIHRRVLVPGPPAGLTLAGPSDCSSNPAVRAAAGGSEAMCRARLDDGAVIMYWNTYRDPDCMNPAECFVGGYRVYAHRSERLIATVAGQDHTAALLPGARLGDCFAVRAFRNPHESRNSAGRCVTVLRTTQRLTLGPNELGQFQAMIHDNTDHGYCTRRSWDSGWATEPWGFVVHTNVFKPDPNGSGAGLHMTIGWVAVEHRGTQPFPCEEGLTHVWRAYLNFSVPGEAREANPRIVFAFTPIGDERATRLCFQYLWRPHHWFYHRDGASPTIGVNDGRILDPGKDPLGLLQLGGGRATFDLSNNEGLRASGQIGLALAAFDDALPTSEIAHPDLHSGKYLYPGGTLSCGLNDPHLEISYVRTQSIPAPLLAPEPEQILQLEKKTPEPQTPNYSRARPTPTPAPH